ncbi:sigma factor-like helix-turn-helix DNA-binding protein [Microbacterium enclense]|uniref:sigma factor-like helix-turn-helix DNA-binding protein n=1 Tax=Microbacterium enclense TaxID=993073 RepID=UPI003D72A38B
MTCSRLSQPILDERTQVTAKTLSERDARILDRYAEGNTLAEIGEREGITRERARQIVAKHGGAAAEEARAARKQARELARATQREQFLAQHGNAASALSHQGFTRPEVIARLALLYPAIDLELAEESLRESPIVFDQANQAATFSDAALQAGIWYLLGSELRLKPDHEWAAVNLSQELLAELAPLLSAAAVTPDELATILGVIGAAQKRALEDPALTITGGRYNELRIELLDAMGLPSAKGAKPWPPTRQTISKRFSGWNDALTSMGLATASRGRTKGLIAFSEDDYAVAIADFVDDANESGIGHTFDAYDRWVLLRRDVGERRPTGASIRNFFGSWLSALRDGTRIAAGLDRDAVRDAQTTALDSESD